MPSQASSSAPSQWAFSTCEGTHLTWNCSRPSPPARLGAFSRDPRGATGTFPESLADSRDSDDDENDADDGDGMMRILMMTMLLFFFVRAKLLDIFRAHAKLHLRVRLRRGTMMVQQGLAALVSGRAIPDWASQAARREFASCRVEASASD